MGLSSIFKSKTEASHADVRRDEAAAAGGTRRRRGGTRSSKAADPGPASAFAQDPADDVQRARSRARHRLIGAVVLLGLGIVGFPLVFETQPRPIPVDIPIEIPRKLGAPPLTIAPERAPEQAPEQASEQAPEPANPAVAARPAVPTPPEDMVTESKDDSGQGASARTADATPAHPPRPPASSGAAAIARATPEPRRADADGARAQALLEGKTLPAASASSTAARFVVQIGAFADPNAAQETRVKVEKLGLKTYTQVASTAAGGRTRVRVGPFASRDEADRALAKARNAGLSAVVITL